MRFAESVEKAKSLRLMLSNFYVDSASVSATYRYSFDMIAKKGSNLKNGRGERIRTSDPLVPNQVRYQTALRPECLLR